jgi:tRNA-2-methylthio-N6-dimethylallyladenosine synthase
MKDTIPLEKKEKRLHTLNEIVNKYSNQNNQTYLNKVVPVLIQGVSEKDPDKVTGYTDTMKLVNVAAPKSTIGTIINVKITDAKSFSLDGEIVK